MERVSLDTSILVYSADPTAGDRHDKARRIVELAASGEGVLTQQVIGEFLNVSRRSAHLDQPRLRRIAAGLCGTFPILATSRALLFDAFDLAARDNIQFWDAVIVSVCAANDVTTLLTEDMPDGRQFGALSILNPLTDANQDRVALLLGG